MHVHTTCTYIQKKKIDKFPTTKKTNFPITLVHFLLLKQTLCWAVVENSDIFSLGFWKLKSSRTGCWHVVRALCCIIIRWRTPHGQILHAHSGSASSSCKAVIVFTAFHLHDLSQSYSPPHAASKRSNKTKHNSNSNNKKIKQLQTQPQIDLIPTVSVHTNLPRQMWRLTKAH